MLEVLFKMLVFLRDMRVVLWAAVVCFDVSHGTVELTLTFFGFYSLTQAVPPLFEYVFDSPRTGGSSISL